MDWYNNLKRTSDGYLVIKQSDLTNNIKYVKKMSERLVLLLDETPRAFFKAEQDNVNDIFGELFVSAFSEMVGKKCIKPTPARFILSDENAEVGYATNDNELAFMKLKDFKPEYFSKGIPGVVSLDYLKDRVNSESINLSRLFYEDKKTRYNVSLKEVLEKINDFVENNAKNGKTITIDPNLNDDIKMTNIIDFVVYQIDRKPENCEIVLQNNGEKNAYLYFADTIDNSKCLFANNSTFKKMWESGIDISKRFVKNAIFDNNYEKGYTGLFYVAQNGKAYDNVYRNNLETYAHDYFVNEKLRTFITKVQSVKYDDVINKIEQDHQGYVVSTYNYEVGKMVYEHQLNELTKRIEQIKSTNNYYQSLQNSVKSK